MRVLRREGIDVLVSMLTSAESEELGLLEERSACHHAGIDFVSFPIPDREVPGSFPELQQLVTQLRQKIRSGKSIGAHCRAGIGRSSLLLAAILCAEGLSARAAFELISEARGLQVPDTSEQVQWIEGFKNSLPKEGIVVT